MVLRPLAEQLVAAATEVPPATIAIAPDSASLAHAAHHRWPAADVAPWQQGGDQRADLLVALPSALLDMCLRDLLTIGAAAARCMVWDGGGTHENALLNAWRDVCGQPPPQLARCAGVVEPPPAWTTWRIIDVVRFDSIAQLRAALVEERGIAPPPASSAALNARIAHHLRAHEGADGTLRIPVSATILGRD